MAIYVLGIFIVVLLGLMVLWLFGERWHRILPSTQAWFKDKYWKPKGKWMNAIHGYLYMRWQNQYIKHFVIQAGKFVPQSVRLYFKDHYHAKVLNQKEAEALIQVKEPITRRDLEQVVPYPNARDFLMEIPKDILVYECGCRNARENHCEPTQVCMWIGQPYVNFIHEHNPHSSRIINKEEALQILREEHERGHVHTAWFKDAMQDRFYCICNCCSCCCAGIEAMRKYDVQYLASSGYVAQLNKSECIQCGKCEIICPFEAINTVNGTFEINVKKCMGCGVCVDHCQHHALELIKEPAKGIPFDVRAMI